MLFFLFTVFVMSMALLVMYRREKNVLKRMMARGRCGLPGIPNPDFFNEFKETEDEETSTAIATQDPFHSQLITLAKILLEKRKQIIDSKLRVDNAENILKNLHMSSVGIRRRYQTIMDELKEELESAEDECKDLNKSMTKANALKSKFFSDGDDECEEEGNALPAPPPPCCGGGGGSTGGSGSPGARRKSNAGGNCNTSDNKSKGSSDCHPPVNVPKSFTTCKCSTPSNPLSTCLPPLPKCDGSSKGGCNTPPQSKSSQPSVCDSIRNSSTGGNEKSCCDTSKSVSRTSITPSLPALNTSSLPCPPPLPNLMPPPVDASSLAKRKSCLPPPCPPPAPCKSSCQPPPPPSCPPPSCPPPSCPPPSCPPPSCPPPSCPPPSCPPPPCPPPKPKACPSPKPKCPQQQSCSTPKSTGGCCQPRSQKSSCTDERCPSAVSCPPQLPEPPDSLCGTPTFVRKPPFSTFLGERLPTAPLQRRSIKQTKQTIYTECIEGDDDNTIVTEVMTSSVTFPPNCCVSVYEEFLSAFNTPPPPPPNTIPIILDECDPCAEIPREISPFEDIENVTHTCGTQTIDVSDEEDEATADDLIRQICNREV